MHRALALFAVALAAACDSQDQPAPLFQQVGPIHDFPGTPRSEAEFAGQFAYQALPGCVPVNARRLDTRTELRVFRGPGVSDGDVRQFLGGLQRYWDHFGVKMFTRHQVMALPLTHAMTFDLDAIEGWVRDNEPDVDLTREPTTRVEMERLERAIGRAILHNTRVFLKAFGSPRRQMVDVLLLQDMVRGKVPDELADLGEGLVGLGLSPELLRGFAPGDPAQALYSWLDAGDFTPVAIVGVRAVRRFLSQPDVVISHEVGHAYGLPHVTTPGNLMTQGELRCNLGLDGQQLDRVAMATTRLAHVLELRPFSLEARAGDLLAGVRQALRARWRRP